jgi:hypothetical protein
VLPQDLARGQRAGVDLAVPGPCDDRIVGASRPGNAQIDRGVPLSQPTNSAGNIWFGDTVKPNPYPIGMSSPLVHCTLPVFASMACTLPSRSRANTVPLLTVTALKLLPLGAYFQITRVSWPVGAGPGASDCATAFVPSTIASARAAIPISPSWRTNLPELMPAT